MHSLARTAGGVGRGISEEVLHHEEGGLVAGVGRAGLEGEGDVGSGGLGPGSVLTTDVFRGSSLIVVLRNRQHFTESFLDEVNVLLMVLDARGNDEALSRGDVVHHELLHQTSINVVDVLGQTESGHTKSVVSVSSPLEQVLLRSKGIEFGEMVEKFMALSIL